MAYVERTQQCTRMCIVYVTCIGMCSTHVKTYARNTYLVRWSHWHMHVFPKYSYFARIESYFARRVSSENDISIDKCWYSYSIFNVLQRLGRCTDGQRRYFTKSCCFCCTDRILKKLIKLLLTLLKSYFIYTVNLFPWWCNIYRQ